MGIESLEKIYKTPSLTDLFKSKMKHAKAAICHSLNSDGLVYVWVCMCVCVFQDPHVNQSLMSHLCDWILRDLKHGD